MKILAVDDSSDWRNAHKMLLNEVFNENLELTLASSAYEGLTKFNDGDYDLVITDLQMEDAFEPMYAGEWLVKEIRGLKPSQKIMIVSSCYNIDKIADENNTNYLSKRNIVMDRDFYKAVVSNLCK